MWNVLLPCLLSYRERSVDQCTPDRLIAASRCWTRGRGYPGTHPKKRPRHHDQARDWQPASSIAVSPELVLTSPASGERLYLPDAAAASPTSGGRSTFTARPHAMASQVVLPRIYPCLPLPSACLWSVSLGVTASEGRRPRMMTSKGQKFRPTSVSATFEPHGLMSLFIQPP